MKCWICGKEATTGEHKIKASDLRTGQGGVSQCSPLFLHTEQRKNIRIGSIKSDKLKFKTLICSSCNNARTASNDKAWEKLSNHLRSITPPITKGNKIFLNEIFPGTVAKSLLNVHLFFIKLFGCAIIECAVPIDLVPFAKAIRQQKPHPKVFLSLGSSSEMGTGFSDISLAYDKISNKCVYATWFYIVEPIAINVIYSEPSEKRNGLIDAWHPSKPPMCINVGF